MSNSKITLKGAIPSFTINNTNGRDIMEALSKVLPPASSGTPMPKIQPAAQPTTTQRQAKLAEEKQNFG